VVVIDFHSTAGDKATYRSKLKVQAEELNVPTIFTSDLQYPNASYHLPHQAVLDLMDYADIFIHPSRSESDPLTVPEAMWKRCGLMLNFDLPVFRQWDGKALFGKFSSNVDVLTGQPGETNTEYSDRNMYMYEMASKVAYILRNNPILANHVEIRKTRSLEAHWQKLWAAIES
jgi:glycosyltransferase involved in cell wall biosynthesis